MRVRRRQRLVQSVLLLLAASAGVYGYGRVVRPNRAVLGDLAEAQLREIFGPGVTCDHVHVDVVDGVVIHGLEVRTPRAPLPTLSARRVELRHDLLALASGAYRPLQIHIDGARIFAHETETGFALDFPFSLPTQRAGGFTPELHVRGASIHYRAMADSPRLRARYVLTLQDVDLDIVPQPGGRLEVRGGFRTVGLGQDEVRVELSGTADPDGDVLDLAAEWNPLRLTDALLGILAEEAREALRGQQDEMGRLVVSLSRHPRVAEGELQVTVGWTGGVRMDLGAIPGMRLIDAQTREHLSALFGSGDLAVEVSREGIDIEGLAARMAGGEVRATGRVAEDGEAYDVVVEARGLRLEDPAVRRALGEDGARIYDAFQPSGSVDARIRLVKERGQDLTWTVDAIVEGATFRYFGDPDPRTGRRVGFPYRVEQVTGRVRVTPGLVRFEDVIGFNGPATVRLRPPEQRSWTGGETGRIRIDENGEADIRLTVDAVDVPVDRELLEAIEGSEFPDLLDTYRIEGRIDHIEVDIVRVPGQDHAAATELRLTLAGRRFAYAPFPLPFEGVSGQVTLRRPERGPQVRGVVYAFGVTGTVEGAATRAEARWDPDAQTGRLTLSARAVPLAGALAGTVLGSQPTREGLGTVWAFLDPRGRADVDLDAPLAEGDPEPMRLEARLLGASVRLDAERATDPIEVTDLTGDIRLRGDVVTIDGLRGRVEDTGVTIEGRVEGGPEGSWDVEVVTERLRVTPHLIASVAGLARGGPLLPTGMRLEPGGRLALELRLLKDPGLDAPFRPVVRVRDLDARLVIGEGTALDVAGERITVRGEAVEFGRITARAPGLTVTVPRGRSAPDGLSGRFELQLEEFTGGSALLHLLPEPIRDTLASFLEDRVLRSRDLVVEVTPDQALTIRGDLELVATEGAGVGGGKGLRGTFVAEPVLVSAVDPSGRRRVRGRLRLRGVDHDFELPIADLDGELEVADLLLGDSPSGRALLKVAAARVGGVRVRDLTIPLDWRDGILRLDPVRGIASGGRFEGRLLVHTREPGGFEARATLEGFDLEALREDLAPSGAPLSGTGRATFTAQNRGTDPRTLTAAGRVSVRDGHLGDLPVVATIFALLGRVIGADPPPRFERAELDFVLRDELVTFRRIQLSGPLFDLPGRGTLDLGGLVDVTFTPDVIKSFALPGIMQLPVVGRVVDAVFREDVLYAIRVRGDLATAEPEVVVLPGLRRGRGDPFPGTGEPEPLPRRIPRWFR